MIKQQMTKQEELAWTIAWIGFALVFVAVWWLV